MAASDDTPEAAIARTGSWLAAWDEQGLHRTGTAGDAAGAAWLAEEARRLGAAPQFEEFALDRLDPAAAHLEMAGERLDGVPVFDAPPTGPDGIAGRLGLTGDGGAAGDIAVAELSPRAVYSGEAERLRRAGGHRALVVLCAGEAPGLGLLNAERFNEPYGAPALHIGSEWHDRLLAAARAGAPARLVAESRRSKARACNVVVRLRGRGAPGGLPLVVMTPRSSWWQSTAERGGGLVCWLESLRALLAAPPDRETIFTANSGHELGHLGLDDFVAHRPGWEQGATWVHFGANLGAAGGQLSVMANDDDWRAIAAAELARAGQPPPLMPPKTAVPSGETRDIHRKGGRYLTLVGTNPLFHLPQDRWPGSVDVPAVARIARAAARIVATLARQGSAQAAMSRKVL